MFAFNIVFMNHECWGSYIMIIPRLDFFTSTRGNIVFSLVHIHGF